MDGVDLIVDNILSQSSGADYGMWRYRKFRNEMINLTHIRLGVMCILETLEDSHAVLCIRRNPYIDQVEYCGMLDAIVSTVSSSRVKLLNDDMYIYNQALGSLYIPKECVSTYSKTTSGMFNRKSNDDMAMGILKYRRTLEGQDEF